MRPSGPWSSIFLGAIYFVVGQSTINVIDVNRLPKCACAKLPGWVVAAKLHVAMYLLDFDSRQQDCQ